MQYRDGLDVRYAAQFVMHNGQDGGRDLGY